MPTSPEQPDTNALVKSAMRSLHKRLSDMMVLQGRALAVTNQQRSDIKSLHDAEFKVFSQFGEDGIIQYLIRETKISQEESIFIEFGVESYLESNTRFLLVNNNWKGLVFDGAEQNVAAIKKQDFYWRNDLTAVHAWIDRDNINQLIKNAGFSGDIGLLSVDIDGNDYWVWQAIDVVNPVIVAVEWNSIFGSEAPISIPYDPKFFRTTAHFSNLYYGASIAALEQLGQQKGYSLIGSNSTGNNLFFVRNDRVGPLKVLTAKEAYVESKIRESRDEQYKLSFIAGKQRLKLIEDMLVKNVKTGETNTLSESVAAFNHIHTTNS
ncbi:hypothetical protein [Alishewanella tabrizica]|uniref:NADH dehydrogenase n=1 Tax=Alishewanella tabrizica TaxID=671278 RepID=A0ABQ2WP35_9ALTE|nr:hypothetical protein [Alishewanella tabrizica]GGW63355.1 hypothetical protein GCM10008111_19250 [Alishewanella tabrizica]